MREKKARALMMESCEGEKWEEGEERRQGREKEEQE
jgi:hypothetical protein